MQWHVADEVNVKYSMYPSLADNVYCFSTSCFCYNRNELGGVGFEPPSNGVTLLLKVGGTVSLNVLQSLTNSHIY